MAWQVDFFADEGGNAPVEEYLTGLPLQHRAKLLALIKMLEQEGPNLPFPYSSQVWGKLRELRTQQGKDKLRILYFGDAKRAFILLHGMVKRSAQLPEKDIRIAVAGRKKGMTSRWKRFYEKQMEDGKLRELVEAELENLQLGVQIAKLRAAENLSQTKLAARAEMSAPKISAMENEPRNLTIGTLIRVAHALGSRVEIKLVRRKGTKMGRRNGGGKVKTRSL
jgi:hypothetical protein